MEVTVCPIFLPRVPLMNPRTLWACQDVACMISARVAPLARRNNARTAAVLLPGRTPSGFGWVAFWGALASFLARVVFLVDWGLEGATRRAGLADGAFAGALGSGGSRRAPLGPQRLDTTPDPPGGRLDALEALYRFHSRQAVPDFRQALGRPSGGQFRQLLLAGKGLGAGTHGCFGVVRRGERGDVVVVVDSERFHISSLFLTVYRDAHIHGSVRGDKQVNSACTGKGDGNTMYRAEG